MAGLAISIGCTVYLSVGGGPLGAFLFSVGLLVICSKGYKLFTGKVCYIDLDNYREIVKILIWNLVAAIGVGLLIRFALPGLSEMATIISEAKLSEGYRIMPLAFMCNVLIFFAVDDYMSITFSSTVRLILCVMVFILCGFEHCIANAFYLSLSGKLFTLQGFLYMVANVCWNGLGGIFAYRIGKRRVFKIPEKTGDKVCDTSV